jgi:hypothetical protein
MKRTTDAPVKRLILTDPITGEVWFDAALTSAAGIAMLLRKVLPLLHPHAPGPADRIH